jgi:cysteine sulfinate desulfinase/cysteine desulfurase-like protein/glyoxylase-like metal-dependent hydrolase (beta-lactamase superfamily II)/rhodanese-related sulfurtransferase
MQIYLDANATTPVLPEARRAAMAAMADIYGNPSSIHGAGLRARALLDTVRASARRVLGAPTGRLLFTSGATEGIQTAVLSALSEIRRRRDAGETIPKQVLYGATEHKAVPEALRHWNALLGLHLEVAAIPVGTDGRHDLAWLRARAPQAALVCTMAANNETGVITDLDGVREAILGSPALWLVDAVQAFGKLSLDLVRRRIDYAPFSGHKLYAPKGIGLLYVREGAPFTPLFAGGGQEEAARSGTENMPAIAALGEVFRALEERRFQDDGILRQHRAALTQALSEAFAGIVFNAPADIALPTTLNFSVPGLSSKLLLDAFDAAQVRVSGGSACSAAKAEPSFVLEAMGLERWRSASAVRLSFGPATETGEIEEACRRIRECGQSLRRACLVSPPGGDAPQVQLLTRYVVDGACCYLVADGPSRRCVVIDPLPELTERLAQSIRCRGLEVVAVLDTHSHADHASAADELRTSLAQAGACGRDLDALGWPKGVDAIDLGPHRLARLPVPGHTRDSTAYLLGDAHGLRATFVGDTVMPGALGRSDFEGSAPLAFASSLRRLRSAVGEDTLLFSAHDYDDRLACTLRTERATQPLLQAALDAGMDDATFAQAKAVLEKGLAPTHCSTVLCGAPVALDAAAGVELSGSAAAALAQSRADLVLIDVREPYEQEVSAPIDLGTPVLRESAPLSAILNPLAGWLALPEDTPVLFYCRSGNRSAQAARALRRLGHGGAWSLAGGLALWRSGEPMESVV